MKKILLVLSVVVVAGFGTYTATHTSNSVALNDLQIKNLEALGNIEDRWCPWGVAEFYIAKDSDLNRTQSAYCDFTTVMYYRARRQCDGKELMSANAWSVLVASGK